MALGGGTFKNMDKPLPGAYVNNVSAAKNLDLTGLHGIVAIALEWDYGNKGDLIKLKSGDFSILCKQALGYDLWDEKLKGIRELVENTTEVYFYILNDNKKASNTHAEAKKGGTRGNALAIRIQTNVDDPSKKDVITLLDNETVDKQIVSEKTELVDNEFVKFKKTVELEDVVKSELSGGTNGDVVVKDHQTFLARMETVSFNTLACLSLDKEIQKLYVAYTKRMREDVGLKFATILKLIDAPGEELYNHESIVAIENKVLDKGAKGNELVYFTAAIYASTPFGKSNLNKKYTGEFKVNTEYTQGQLTQLAKEGKFVYHQVGDEVRVLEDINSLTTFTEEKGEEFKENQVVRIVDALAIEDAIVFNTMYLGKVNINKSALESYENKVRDIREHFVDEGALVDYDKDIKVEKVEGVRGAVKVTSGVRPAECFRQLYATNLVRG